MTVQDIPDIPKSKINQTKTKQNLLAVPNNTTTATTYDNHKNSNSLREFSDTVSTHTLTPPPSECGTTQSRTHQANNARELELQQTERELIMSLSGQSASTQHHSYLYPQQARIETLSITSDTTDDDQQQIPYHAREDSRPFTYGNISSGRTTPAPPSQGTMIKSQSGLSSPSMVRKALNHPQQPKAQPRNEFEEMLLERREKILNDKYSIGDTKPSSNGVTSYESRQWYSNGSATPTPQQQQNGYTLPHDLLKRSNTMDGSFGRGPTPGDG